MSPTLTQRWTEGAQRGNWSLSEPESGGRSDRLWADEPRARSPPRLRFPRPRLFWSASLWADISRTWFCFLLTPVTFSARASASRGLGPRLVLLKRSLTTAIAPLMPSWDSSLAGPCVAFCFTPRLSRSPRRRVDSSRASCLCGSFVVRRPDLSTISLLRSARRPESHPSRNASGLLIGLRTSARHETEFRERTVTYLVHQPLCLVRRWVLRK